MKHDNRDDCDDDDCVFCSIKLSTWYFNQLRLRRAKIASSCVKTKGVNNTGWGWPEASEISYTNLLIKILKHRVDFLCRFVKAKTLTITYFLNSVYLVCQLITGSLKKKYTWKDEKKVKENL